MFKRLIPQTPASLRLFVSAHTREMHLSILLERSSHEAPHICHSKFLIVFLNAMYVLGASTSGEIFLVLPWMIETKLTSI